jgi:exodeoxyribonuclease V gamma subunit
MRFKHRLGDRSRRNEDRYLFLEAILSARQSLWLSYKSKNQSNDEAMTPSVVLAELLDYICEDDNQTSVIRQHPLQPFNPVYYDGRSEFFSFNQDWLGAIADEGKLKDEPKIVLGAVKQEPQQDVLLEQLIQFFQQPARFYLNNQLDISLYQYTDDVEDHEPFELDGLTQFKIKQHMLQDTVHGLHTGKTASEGELAFGEIGLQHWQGLEQQLQPMFNAYEDFKEYEALPPIEVNMQLADERTRLLGWQYKVFDQYHIVLVPSKLKAKHIIQLMLEQASLSAMGYQKHSRLICQDQMVSLMPMSATDATSYLNNLVDIFIQSHSKPVALLPETAWQLIAPLKKTARKSQLDNAQAVFEGTSGMYGVSGEREDLHVRRCFGELTQIPQDTIHYAQDVFGIWIDQELFEVDKV